MVEEGEHTPEPPRDGRQPGWDSTDEASWGPSMVARPAVLRQWQGRQATSQGAPQWGREQGWTPTRFAQTPECDKARERSGLTVWIPAPRSQKHQSTRPVKSKPVRGSHDNPGAKTLGKTGKRSTVLNPERELEDPTLMGTSIVSSKNGATRPDSNPPSGPGEQEKPTLRLRPLRSDCHHHERIERDTSVQVRGKRSPDANPTYDFSTRKRRLESQDRGQF